MGNGQVGGGRAPDLTGLSLTCQVCFDLVEIIRNQWFQEMPIDLLLVGRRESLRAVEPTQNLLALQSGGLCALGQLGNGQVGAGRAPDLTGLPLTCQVCSDLVKIIRNQWFQDIPIDLLLVGHREALRSVEPTQDLVALYLGRLVGQVRVVGRVGPIPEIVHEPVFLGVVVDVDHQPGEIRVRRDRNAAKGSLEEASGAVVRPVDGLGVGVKEVTELLAGLLGCEHIRDPKGF